MDPATVALILSFSALAIAGTGKPRGAFGYPDDDHVIITQYGPMRYEPIAADQMNRPYDADDGAAKTAPSGRGYYKAEVIPLDMNTWKPAAGADGHWVGRSAAGGRADSFDVPLRVGYSVRPAAARRRRNDYLLMGYRPRPQQPQWNHRDPQPAVPRRRVDTTVPLEVPIRPRWVYIITFYYNIINVSLANDKLELGISVENVNIYTYIYIYSYNIVVITRDNTLLRKYNKLA